VERQNTEGHKNIVTLFSYTVWLTAMKFDIAGHLLFWSPPILVNSAPLFREVQILTVYISDTFYAGLYILPLWFLSVFLFFLA